MPWAREVELHLREVRPLIERDGNELWTVVAMDARRAPRSPTKRRSTSTSWAALKWKSTSIARHSRLKISTLVVSGSPSGTFAWTYTNAGRELTESDPLTGVTTTGASGTFHNVTYVPLSFTYDSYGRVSGAALPRSNFNYSNFSYDAEDGTTGWQNPVGLVQDIFTKRNELAMTGLPANYNVVHPISVFANGGQCAVNAVYAGATQSCTLDSRSNQLQKTNATSTGAVEYSNGSGTYTLDFDSAHAYGYDAAGRQVTDASTTCSVTYSSDPATQGTTTSPTYTSQRTYDTDNHIIEQTLPANYEQATSACGSGGGATPTYGFAQTNAYSWAPDGHIARESITSVENGTPYTSTSTYGWDGDDLLYVVDGSAIGIAIEKLGIIASSSSTPIFSIYDRDWTGTLVNIHQANYFSAVQLNNADPYHGCLAQHGQVCSNTEAEGGALGTIDSTLSIGYPALSSQRADGYGDGVNVFQGVRAYDPQMNQWTTPDAYAGDVSDPMSQHPYMWNGNNPLAYSDPSGYNSGAIALVFGGVEGLACPECLIGTGIGLGIVILKSQHDKADEEAKAGVHPAPEAGPAPVAGPVPKDWGTADDPRVKENDLKENPNRNGSFGKNDANGKFREWIRADPADPTKPGNTWGGRDHEHHHGEKKHLAPGAPLTPPNVTS